MYVISLPNCVTRFLPIRRAARGRISRPPNRQAVIQWFRDTEEPKGSGLDPNSKQVAPWFHGQ